MTPQIIFSSEAGSSDWVDIDELKQDFGTKAATLATLPRLWTPPFVLISWRFFSDEPTLDGVNRQLNSETIERIRALAETSKNVIVRSSVIGETIWERGTFESVVVSINPDDFEHKLSKAIAKVLQSASSRQAGIVIQNYIKPVARGEFGNLLRVSKTRDQWELTYEDSSTRSSIRFNAQRDRAADPNAPIEIKAGLAQERLFGPVCAWLNNELLRGVSKRLNCEWVTDRRYLYLVQIDQEDEDSFGVNPFQLRIAYTHHPSIEQGTFIKAADPNAMAAWDKLQVLNDLYGPSAPRRPMLFYVPLSCLPESCDTAAVSDLVDDFRQIVGPDNIVVRTSVRAGNDKEVNLPRTEGLRPEQAACQCLDWRDTFRTEGGVEGYAFVIHRFIAARSSAWARAEPGNPLVEIHGLWGLPDALQYCPYDIWEVHVPTSVATEFTEYKSNMLIARDNGEWEYVRIKNEIGRSLSISRREALEIAEATLSIAERLGRPCHVMWFVGCASEDGNSFNIPWYWTKAHEAEKNLDRSNYQLFRITNRSQLEEFRFSKNSKSRVAIELMPTDLSLFRDMDFIEAVGSAAKEADVPVMIDGSTLAHAYFALRRKGCTVVARGEKEHTRVRRSASFGKLVRDKIPARIAQRKEAEVTRKLPQNLKLNFLISKLLEEALEVRNAESSSERKTELADVFEILRALAQMEGFSIQDISETANEKRAKAGGFEDGLVLLQTGILGSRSDNLGDDARTLAQVLARKVSGDTFELPFTFFGFMDVDQPRSIVFDDLGIRLHITLKNDRIELRLARGEEQLELPLDMSVS
jgi:predicted house-cleaning noncanonical NTP pyrophosphatase (MazG superfamily)